MNAEVLAIYFFACCTWVLALLILLKRNDELSRAFTIFCFFVTGWGIPITWQINNDVPYNVALIATRIGDCSALFIPPSWLYFVLTYLEKNKQFKRWIHFTYILSTCLAFFAPTSLFVPKLKQIMYYTHYIHPGPVFHLFTIEFFLVVAYGFYELLKSLQIQSGVKRMQTMAFIVATACGFSGGGFTFFLIYDTPFPQYAIFLMPFYPFIMAYAIARTGFLDADAALAIHRDKLALIGLMSASINHEFKNPLFMIQELAKKIERLDLEKDGETVQAAARSITQQTERMRTLAVRLSEFGRGNPGNSNGEADLRRAIDTALFFASHELKYGNIDTKLSLPPDLPKIKGDQSQFEQIFLNLILNAYHAMPDGGTLSIEVTHDDKCVQVKVSDTGVGISPDKIKNIFKPFYTTKSSGTGLGLYIVKTLVEKCGGRIWVGSAAVKGAEFILQFGKMHST